MRRLSCKIEIWRNWTTEEGAKLSRRWVVERVAGVKITGDTSSLQDTCVVSLARNTKWEGEPRIPVRRGDEVKVWLGYDGELKLRFIGQVQEVSAKTPTTLTCIDGMMKLQHTPSTKSSYRSCDVRKLLGEQIHGVVEWELSGEVNIGQYRVTATTVAGVLRDLKENYGVTSAFVVENDKALLKVWTVRPGMRKMAGKFEDGLNMIENQLTYRRAADIQVKVKGVSIQADGSRISYEEGEGEQREIYRYGLSMAELKAAVKDEIERLKWDGLSGSFTTFGEPQVEKTDVVEVKTESVERGRYQVKGVNVNFGTGGYRQTVELGRRITEN
ncbi:MAG: hypothetical protein IKQ20_04020 [Bacteroidales bacterium]|nr:hypothetical protein [Bacteroidales bacterium]